MITNYQKTEKRVTMNLSEDQKGANEMSEREQPMISVNCKKYSARTSLNRLIGENYRTADTADYYDNGHRVIDTGKTGENVFLLPPPDDYDRTRRERIDWVNEERSKRVDYRLKVSNYVNKLKATGEYKKALNQERARTRKLRADVVDTIGHVIQPSKSFMDSLPPDQQDAFFRDCLEIMQDHPDYFGWIETFAVHKDENSIHAQALATTINTDTLTADTDRIMGNKTKMSQRQTLLADALQKRGWNVRRGMKRVDNPEYKNFLSDMEKLDVEVNRHNDAVLMDVWRDLKRRERDLQAGRESLSASRTDFKREVARIKADTIKDRQRASDAVTEAHRIMDQADQRQSRADDILRNALSEQAEAERSKRELTALIDRADQSVKDAQQATKDLRAGVLKVSRARAQARETEQIGRDLADALKGLTELDEAQKGKGLAR